MYDFSKLISAPLSLSPKRLRYLLDKLWANITNLTLKVTKYEKWGDCSVLDSGKLADFFPKSRTERAPNFQSDALKKRQNIRL